MSEEYQLPDSADNRPHYPSLAHSPLQDSQHVQPIEFIHDHPQPLTAKNRSIDFEMKMSEGEESVEPTQPSPGMRSLLISIDDSNRFPSVLLEHSPKGQRCLQIKIPMYRTSTFMKVQTQNYILEVMDPNLPQRKFQIERRYSEFIELYESLFYNQPGFILCPFPDKNFASFFKIKLGLGFQENSEKVELIQRRMLELEKFINFVTHHPLLRNAEEIHIFLAEDRGKFEEGMARLGRYVEEYKVMEKPSQVKNWVDKGKYIWSTYVKKESPRADTRDSCSGSLRDIKFTEIEETLLERRNKLANLMEKITKLYEAQKNFSEFTDFKTENDTVLRLCAKQSSSKEFCRRFANALELHVLDELSFGLRRLEEAEKVLRYRQGIVCASAESKKEEDHEKREKLQRRLEVLETNFTREWGQLQQSVDGVSEEAIRRFHEAWQDHKASMMAIWKKG